MRILLCAAAIVLLTSFAAHAEQKIVIIGDSISEGYGVTRDEAYPTLLQKKITEAGKKWSVVNQSISGSTTSSAPARVTWALKGKPDLIVLELGGNDGLRGVPIQTIDDNLSKAVRLCQEAKVKVIIAGMRIPPNYGADYVGKFAAVFPAVAKRLKVPLIPFLLANVGGKRDLSQDDGIHPNAKGHAVVAETVFAALEKQL